tara:strand:- start:6937 stop:7173 length:237 start_codon:yes stop_codon:yes gene_type:complete
MKVTYETDYIVFDVTKGPKSIVEELNARGEQGWYPASTVNVAGTSLVFFLVKPTFVMPNIKGDTEKHLNKLWGNNGSE